MIPIPRNEAEIRGQVRYFLGKGAYISAKLYIGKLIVLQAEKKAATTEVKEGDKQYGR